MRAAYSHVADIFSPNFNVTRWEWCHRLNGTYLDCPIANRTTNNFVVFAHNPSTEPVEYIKIKTSHANYDVVEYVNDAPVKLPAEAICISKYLENGTHIQDCDLFVNVKIVSTKRIEVNYNSKVDLSIPETTEGVLKIANQNETYTYLGTDADHGVAFQVDKYGSKYAVAFDVRHYNGDGGGDAYNDTDNCPSGAYIFKAAKGDQLSHRYASLYKTFSYVGKFVQEIHMIFTDPLSQALTGVRLRTYITKPVTEWEVNLYGIPYTPEQGKEVIV
jgi:hypothetical protein